MAALTAIACAVHFSKRHRRSDFGSRPLVDPNGSNNGIGEIKRSAIATPSIVSPSCTHFSASESFTEESSTLSALSLEEDREARRQERQRFLLNQMYNIQREIESLNREVIVRRASSTRTLVSEGTESLEVDVEDLMSQLREAQAHVFFLQQHQQSAWAMGLTDNPPSGYDTELSFVVSPREQLRKSR
jgi:hypothetical protein